MRSTAVIVLLLLLGGINYATDITDRQTAAAQTGILQRSDEREQEPETKIEHIENLEPNTTPRSRNLREEMFNGADNGLPSRGAAVNLGTFVITAYSLDDCEKSPQDEAYGITATGAPVKERITAAADWDVLPPGSVVYITGVGYRIIEDCGGGVQGAHIDIYIPNHQTAVIFGVQRQQVYLVERGKL